MGIPISEEDQKRLLRSLMNVRAAEIAVETVRSYLQEKGGGLKVIFNVFGDADYEIYRRLLAEN